MNTFSERIKYIRGELTQIEFAAAIGVSQRSIVFYEKENRLPRDRTLKKISDIFNVNMNWLKNGSGEIFKNIERQKIPETADMSANQQIPELTKPNNSMSYKIDECRQSALYQVQVELSDTLKKYVKLQENLMKLKEINMNLRFQLREKEDEIHKLENEIASLREALKEQAAIQGGNKREAG